jgi:hypothetical protein
MGVITGGILSGFRGKVGAVVGAKWKSIDYMRAWVIPSNPNTAGQQAARAKFSALVANAKQVLTTLLHVYWDPFYSNMSGMNAFISKNYSKLGIGNTFDLDCVISDGSLEPTPSITSADVTANSLVVLFSSVCIGNGLPTDVLKCVVYRQASKSLAFYTSAVARSAGTATLTVSSVVAGDICYIFFHRGTGGDLMVSSSLAVTII